MFPLEQVATVLQEHSKRSSSCQFKKDTENSWYTILEKNLYKNPDKKRLCYKLKAKNMAVQKLEAAVLVTKQGKDLLHTCD